MILFKDLYDEILIPKEISLVSQSSMVRYRNVINTLNNFFTPDRSIEDITIEEVKNFLLTKKHFKRSTIILFMVTVKAIFNFLEEQGKIDRNITRRIKVPALQEAPVELPTEEERIQLDKAANSPIIPPRTRAFYWILRDTGLRSCEVGAILIQDIDFNERFIYIRNSKNKICKLVPFTEFTKKVIQEYIASAFHASVYLFPHRYDINKPLGSDVIYRSLNDIWDKAFDLRLYKKRRGSHILRHMFASEWVEHDGNLVSLQHIMGWKSLEMANRYVKISKTKLKKSFDEVQEKMARSLLTKKKRKT